MTADEHARMQELEGLVKRYRSRITALKLENEALLSRPCPACELDARQRAGQPFDPSQPSEQAAKTKRQQDSDWLP